MTNFHIFKTLKRARLYNNRTLTLGYEITSLPVWKFELGLKYDVNYRRKLIPELFNCKKVLGDYVLELAKM